MADLSKRFRNLSPEQQELLKRMMKEKDLKVPFSEGGKGPEPVAKVEPPEPVEAPKPKTRTEKAVMDFGIFFFSSDGSKSDENKYDFLFQAAEFADNHGFNAVWTPERHFQTFGGLYPNPAVLCSALAARTQNLKIRAGSVVVPLHGPVRIAEDWALIDNISNGRVGISCATGWHNHDFVIRPDVFKDRYKLMYQHLDTVQKLWRGETVTLPGPDGEPVPVRTLPRPVQASLPIWITANSHATFQKAGAMGANILTALIGPRDQLGEKIQLYRKARIENGHDPRKGIVSLMIHTYMSNDLEEAKEKTREPLKRYLKNFLNQYKDIRRDTFQDGTEETVDEVLAFAFERYFKDNSLIGTPEKCQEMVETLHDLGVDDLGCLMDFGLSQEDVMSSLAMLAAFKKQFARG